MGKLDERGRHSPDQGPIFRVLGQWNISCHPRFQQDTGHSSNIYNITVTVRPANQEGVLQSVNVTAYNSTQYGSSSRIATGITDANGRVSFQDVPNGTMFFASYARLDYSILISESSQTVSSNGQSISLIADQNAGTTTLPWEVFFIASFVLAPKPTTPDIAAKRKTET